MEIWNYKKKEIAFFPETLDSFEIDTYTRKALELLNKNQSDEIIENSVGLSHKELLLIKARFIEATQRKLSATDHLNKNNLYLKRLSINISNTCNMKCKYCYANFGAYGSHKSVMDMNILKETLDKFYSAFKEIAVLQVFGGEPFLNFEGFQYICEYIEKKYQLGEIKYKTLITTVTNGTVLNKKIIDLINKYNIYITVSLDGPKDIQDANRISLGGDGTFDRVIKNIYLMKKETGQPKQIEATYNQVHVNNHVSVLDLINFINSKFDDISLHVAPVSAKKEECFALADRLAFINSIDDIFNYNRGHKRKANYLILDSMIRSLESPKKKTSFCDAGIDLFSVSYTGYVYPCYMFIDEPGFALMNVQDKDFNRSNLLEKARPYREYDRQQEKKCEHCPIVNICDGCMGMNYFATGNIHTSPAEECDMKRRMVKSILFNVTNIS